MKTGNWCSKGFGVTTVLIGAGILILLTSIGLIVQKNMGGTEEAKRTIKQFVKKTSPSPSGTISQTGGVSGLQPTVSAAEATDTKIDTDMTEIDAALNAINAEALNIDEGLNDQMGDLSE